MFFRFLRDEKAAITVDYVVLTAAAAFIGLPVVATISGGTETRANNFSDRQVEVWRKGKHALANYSPINEEGFELFWEAMQEMTPEEMAALSAFSMYVQDSGEIENMDENAQAFLNEMEAGVLISYAEGRNVRLETETFDVDAVGAVWDTYDFGSIETVYGTTSQSTVTN